MFRRMSVFTYIIFSLMVIGIFMQLMNRPSSMLIPILVFGGVFLLYKYPPKGFGSSSSSSKPYRPSNQREKAPNRKPIPFRVIQGNKPDKPNHDDDTPRYH